jgi:hypothetical protein
VRKNQGLRIIIMAVCLFLLFSLGCKEKSKNKVPIKPKPFSEAEIKDIILELHKERIVLLSIKYGIEQLIAEQILAHYLYKLDLQYSAPEKNVDDIQKTIKELSLKYNIPEQKLASLITDYRMWGTCEDSQEASPID